jgi:AraC-type DNA-binding domain-containing proteins
MQKYSRTITEFRSYRLPEAFPVLLLTGEHWRISDVPSGRLHFHNCLEIGICHTDGGTMEFYGKPLAFNKGDITCVPKNVPHTTYSAPGTASKWSYIFLEPKELFRGVLPSSWPNYDLEFSDAHEYLHVFPKTEYPHLHTAVLHIIDELAEQKPGYQISARGLLISLYIELYRVQYSEETKVKNVQATSQVSLHENALEISPALNFIEDNYMHTFTIMELADMCHWSQTHFRRVFHELIGVSPLEYINNVRILKSCRQLCSSENSILEISGNTGFRSLSSFNRNFFKVMQMSPREYRKLMIRADKKLENLSVLESTGWMSPE